jgi:hypothetical protein
MEMIVTPRGNRKAKTIKCNSISQALNLLCFLEITSSSLTNLRATGGLHGR